MRETIEPACPETANTMANYLMSEMLHFITDWPAAVNYTTALSGVILLLEGLVKDVEDRSEDRNNTWRKAVVTTICQRWKLDTYEK